MENKKLTNEQLEMELTLINNTLTTINKKVNDLHNRTKLAIDRLCDVSEGSLRLIRELEERIQRLEKINLS